MSFELVAYLKLKDSIKESVKTLILDHDSKHKINPDKLMESTEILTGDRKVQAQLLLTAINLLDKSTDESEQARVLNTLAYYIYDKINASYNYLNPERSCLFRSLTTALNITVDNKPKSVDLIDMYPSLKKFFSNHVYVDGDMRKGYLPTQPLAIKGYIVENDIKDLGSKINDITAELVDAAKQKNEQLHKPQSSSIFGWWGSSAASTTTKEVKQHKESSLSTSPI